MDEEEKIVDAEPETFTVVDVRDPEEFAGDHTPGALNLPLKNSAAGSGVLDKEKKIRCLLQLGWPQPWCR